MSTVVTGAAESVGDATAGMRRIRAGTLRITVVVGDVEVDVSVPAGIAVVAVLPALSALLGQERRDAVWPHSPSLSTILGAELDPRASLFDNDIRDGDTVVVHDRRAVSPPVFDDVTDAVSTLGASRSWTPSDSITAVGIVVATSIAVASWTVTTAPGSASVACAVTLAIVVTLVSSICASVRVPAAIVSGARIGACGAAFAAGAVLVPGSDPASDAVLGFALAATASVVTSMFAGDVGRAIFTAVSTSAIVCCVASAVAALTTVPLASVAAVASAVSLLLMHWAPRMSASRAGIRLPPVPLADAGTRLDDADRQGPPTRPSDAARAAAHDSASADVVVVAARARTAQQYLTGYTTGLTVCSATGAALVSTLGITDHLDGARLTFGAIVAAILCCRGRECSDRIRNATALGAGVATILVVLGAGSSARPDLWVWWLSALILVPVVGTLIAVVAPRHRFSPVARRSAEVAELVAVASVVPLTCWIVGAFSAVRGL